MLRKANETKRQIIEQLNRRVLKEIAPAEADDMQTIVEKTNTWEGIKNMLYTLEKQMDEKGLGEHIKNLKSHLQELIYIQNNQYGDEGDERRYDDREVRPTDDESRYDDRNYQYGNNPDDDLNEHEEPPIVRRSERDMLRRRPYSPKARFKAGL